MPELTVTLTGKTAALLARLTAEGGFATPEAALTALLAEEDTGDRELERWLRDLGVARYDAHRADPSRAIGVAEARARLSKDA